ncbi:uncharacterized protein LAESUDRAFT_311453 [Laetiporus sulphureus 93-53]|uniref:Uncharacterized protein n=1 Tax=Laetiporus sulphureus 93-53 TaxID=1314785 RepID=A0A165D4G9_9APHY|nr:uncharacterized protein LAESUDRAFT_311453 [Laetiporus sulphureus 93-53]KZT04139.1 hypothetical protein LAESUDRAFT_311453 [Laetiporus sulphureus 93-53]
MAAEQAVLASVNFRPFGSETGRTDVDNAVEVPSMDIERSGFSVVTIASYLEAAPLQQGESEGEIEQTEIGDITAPHALSPAGLQFYRELFAYWASSRTSTEQPVVKKPDTMNTLATMSKLTKMKKTAAVRKPGMKLKRRPRWGAVDSIPVYVDNTRAWQEFMAAVWNELADGCNRRGAAMQPTEEEARDDQVRAPNRRGEDC